VNARILLVSLLFATSACFAGPTKEQFIGHWRYIGDSQTVDYTFRDDGTFNGSILEDGKIVLQFGGKWSIEGDKLNYEFTKSTPEVIAAGSTDQDTIAEMTRDYYIIETRYFSKRQYSRVD
jgi:lipocalin-like protein